MPLQTKIAVFGFASPLLWVTAYRADMETRKFGRVKDIVGLVVRSLFRGVLLFGGVCLYATYGPPNAKVFSVPLAYDFKVL